jgi:hypothetical protein
LEYNELFLHKVYSTNKIAEELNKVKCVGFEAFKAVVMKNFIFRLALLAICAMLISCLAYSFTTKLEVRCSSETSGDFQRTTWHYIREDRTLQMNYIKGLLSFRPLPIVLYFDNDTMFRKMDLFPFSGEWFGSHLLCWVR